MRGLINCVLDWAEERQLIGPDRAERQMLKAVAEMGEFAEEVLNGTKQDQTCELGDVMVTLIITGANLGIDIEEALSVAYDKISKRKGSTVNGVFVKE